MVIRDSINWMKVTKPGWCDLEPPTMLESLTRSLSSRIPEEDFRTPLDDAVAAVLREHGS